MEPNNSQNVVNEPVLPVASKSGLNLLITVVVGVLMLLVGLGGGYLLFANKTEINPTYKIQVSPTTIITTSPSPTADPTAEWKTYTTGKFSFKYPSTIIVKPTDPDYYVILFTPSTPPQAAEMAIDARVSDVSSSTANYLRAVQVQKDYLTNVITSDVPNGIRISGVVGPGLGEGDKVTTVVFKYGEGPIVVQFTGEESQMELFDQILSTFKFLP